MCIKLVPNDRASETLPCEKTEVIERKKNVETNMKTEMSYTFKELGEEP